MAKRLKMTVLLGTLALVLPGLAACGGKKDPDPTPTHTHDYVEHAAKDPTCTDAGNALYYSCKGCEKYFDAAKAKEIEKDSWVIGALGHEYCLEIGGNFKTAYLSGDEFDPEGMTVKKGCEREGCNFGENVSSYDIHYEDDEAGCLKAGDEEVSIVAGELSATIDVTVSLRFNEINGLEDSYDLNCKEALDLEGVYATEGEVSVKYYSDEEFTNEITVDDLIGDDVYYAMVSSDGVDPDYEVAKASTVLYVTHDFEEHVPTTAIGYKSLDCSICGYQEESENIMEDADIDLASVTAYGINADTLTVAAHEGVTIVDRPLYIFPDNQASAENPELRDVVLPKINYTAYDNVVMFFESPSNDPSWGGIGIGIFKADDLIPFTANHGVNATFCLEAVYNPDTEELDIKFSCSDGLYGVVNVDNEDIINGVEGLKLLGHGGLSRYITLGNIYLNHTHTPSETQVASKEVIGFKKTSCTVCKAPLDGDLMTNEDTEFWTYTSFGANADDFSPSWGKDVCTDKGMAYVFTTEDLIRDIGLPKVNYTLFKDVTFAWKGLTTADGNRSISIGVNADGDILAMGHHTEFKIIVSYANEQLTIKAVDYTTNPAAETTPVIANVAPEVINGLQNLHLKGLTNVKGTRMGLNRCLVNHDCASCTEKNYANRTDYIGKKAATCVCGAPVDGDKDHLMTEKDINWATSDNFYGRSGIDVLVESFPLESWYPAGSQIGDVIYALGTNTTRNVNLPRIAYADYDKVQLNFHSSENAATNCGLGIGEANNLYPVADRPNYPANNGVITMTMSEGKLIVQAADSVSVMNPVEVTDADVINGSKSLELILSQTQAGYRAFSFGKLCFNHTVCNKDGYMPNTKCIGNCLATCTACGKVHEELSQEHLMSSSDINVLTNTYEASISSETGATDGSVGLINSGNRKGIEYSFSTSGTDHTYTLGMPKINFDAYEKVKITFWIDSGWFKFGLDSGACSPVTVDHSTATVEITPADADRNTYNMKMVIVQSGKGDITLESSFADPFIMNGTKSLGLYGRNSYKVPARLVCVTGIEVTLPN